MELACRADRAPAARLGEGEAVAEVATQNRLEERMQRDPHRSRIDGQGVLHQQPPLLVLFEPGPGVERRSFQHAFEGTLQAGKVGRVEQRGQADDAVPVEGFEQA